MSGEEKKKNKQKIIKYSTIISVLVICAIVFSLPIIWGIGVGENENKFEISGYLSQIITNLFVVFGVIVALWQYVIYSRRELELKDREIYDMDKARIQRAIELSEFYKDKIINEFPPIRQVFLLDSLKEVLNKIPVSKMDRFDYDELRSLMSESDLQYLKTWNSQAEVADTLTNICRVYDKWSSLISEIEVEENGKIIKVLRVNKSLILNKFKILMMDTLNNMEYFAMNFNYGTADDKVVYQSLHSSYNELVELFYFTICQNNDSNMLEKKVFTNTIQLYKKWKNMSIKQVESQYAASTSCIVEGKKLKV